MKKMMKNLVTAMLAVAMLLTPAIAASADDSTASTEERTLITLPEFDFPDDTQINLSNYDLPIEEMKALFPETVEVKSENGAYYVKDIGAARADAFCYNGYERYDMTFDNGYWTVDLTEEELSGDILVTFYGEEFWMMGYLDGIRENFLQISTSGNVQYIGIYYSYDMVAMGYVTEDGRRVENEHKNDLLITHKVRFDVEGSSFSYAYYDINKNLSYVSVYTNDYYYLMEEGWSSSWGSYIACDAPAGFENYTLDDFATLVSHDIGCQHEWVAADCDTPKTCSKCEKTKGEALGHSWVAADCDTPKTCSVCGETEGEALGHSWKDATTEAPKTCENCGETEGEKLDPPAAPLPPEPSETPDEPNWFVKIWNAILDFFRKLFGLK